MFVDIAFNCTEGEYGDGLAAVMQRARANGVMPIIAGLSVGSSIRAAELAEQFNTACYFGVHPLHIPEGEQPEALESSFVACQARYPGRIVGIGECGLDYFRSSAKQIQLDWLREHVKLQGHGLSYFYHCREAFGDFASEVRGTRGVVHSFDGTPEEAQSLIGMGFYIGLNGVSVRSLRSINAIRIIPAERILLETDSPYCLIRKSFAGYEYTTPRKPHHKGKNEPALIRMVAEAVANIKNIELEELERVTYANTLEVFPGIRAYAEHWGGGAKPCS